MLSFILLPLASCIALAFGVYLILHVLRHDEGTEQMREISNAVREGARAYMRRQYTTISILAVILGIILAVGINLETSIGFFAGAFLSGLAGWIGMSVSVRANVRVAKIAEKGIKDALSLSFRGGAVTGMMVVGLGLLGVSTFYLAFLFLGYEDPVTPIVGFGFGACLISLFARIGGGIYTKSADVGADLVGKVEAGIPEDDPRNPAVIADNVGDNVGDCAGMGADLFETYAVTAIGAMLLGYLEFEMLGAERFTTTILYPLLIGAVAIFASVIGANFVRIREGEGVMRALYKGLLATGVVAGIAFWFVTEYTFGSGKHNLYFCSLIGLFVAISLFAITEYYTSKKYSPVRGIAKAAQSGSAINVIYGISVGMESTFPPAIVVCSGILLSYSFGGVYGIAIAVMSMLSLTGMIIALDAYGPITDNAGGIAEMGSLDEKVRKVTDALDAVGNTTKAITKSFAIGSAALAALTLFAAYMKETGIPASAFTLSDEKVLVGLLIGGVIPFLFSARCLRAVGRSAFSVVEEVRRQFREIPGIMERERKPEYARCVDIVTKSALKEMVVPGSLAVISPLAVGFVLGPLALGGLLLGSIISGFFLALHLATSGAAWDNAKKYIEEGNLGGKGSEPHKSSVVGDTVGDPSKDTAGPAINPLIKVMNTVAIIFAPLFIYSLL